MSADIVDLDAFVGEPRKAKLAGQTLLFPRDIPTELYLEIHELNQRSDDVDDEQLISKLRTDVLELLQVHQPAMTRLPAAMSLTVLVRTIGAIYGSSGAEEAREDPTPPKPARTGKSPSPKSRSRSTPS